MYHYRVVSEGGEVTGVEEAKFGSRLLVSSATVVTGNFTLLYTSYPLPSFNLSILLNKQNM